MTIRHAFLFLCECVKTSKLSTKVDTFHSSMCFDFDESSLKLILSTPELNKKKENNMELKRLAQNARKRLISSGANNGIRKTVPSLNSNVKFKVISNSDEEFSSKARQVLESDTLSPIKELMDEDYFNSLDSINKQKYLLEVVEKFNRVKAKFDELQARKLVY